MKKHFLIASMLFAALISLVSCGGNSNNNESNTNSSTPSVIPSVEPSVEPSVIPSVEPSDDTNDQYTGFAATVLYPNGTPAANVDVQWCIGEVCFNAITTDQNGVAKNPELNKGKDYIVHITEMSIPVGYTYNPNLYTSNDDNLQITIQLEVLNSTTGTGSKEDAYVLNDGYSKIFFEGTGNANIQYFSFKALENATYEIETIYDVNSAFTAKPVLHEFEAGFTSRIAQRAATGTGEGDNFKYSFTTTASTTYYFGIVLLDGSTEFIDLPIVITKK